MGRQVAVSDELESNIIHIQIKTKFKEHQKSSNEQNNHQLGQSKHPAITGKDFFQFIKEEKLLKEKRRNNIQKQHQKQIQKQIQKRQAQQKLFEADQAKKNQQKRQREQELLKSRQKQKQLIKKHELLYQEFQNRIFHSYEKPVLIPLMNRFESQQLKRLNQQKEKLYLSYEKSRIDEHERQYLEQISKRKQDRQSRMEEIKQVEEIEKSKSWMRFQSSFKFENPQQEYEKKKKHQYLLAKQKRNRILSYKDKVKSEFTPLIDQNKKQQLLKLIQHFEDTKNGHYKKKILDSGEIFIEKLPIKDQKKLGLGYLQIVKQQVERARVMKIEVADMSVDSNHQQSQDFKKPMDYLKQLRERKSKSTVSGFSSVRKTVFANTKSSEMSFEDQLRKIEEASSKLMEKTKQQQMLLKHGKFKTSEQILAKKQIIDKNYIDLVNMKLKIIEKDK